MKRKETKIGLKSGLFMKMMTQNLQKIVYRESGGMNAKRERIIIAYKGSEPVKCRRRRKEERLVSKRGDSGARRTGLSGLRARRAPPSQNAKFGAKRQRGVLEQEGRSSR